MSEEDKKNMENNTTSEEVEKQQEPVNESAEPEVNEWEAKYNEANDKFLRLYSEFENYKRRTNKEKADIIRLGGADVIKAILPTLDDFERAIKANEKSEESQALKDGFILIYTKLLASLEARGLKKMEVLGHTLDTDLHEAITQIPAPSDDMKGKIVDVLENGYFLHDTVVRYAKVVIGS
jgi:molecular chaperone GrpE